MEKRKKMINIFKLKEEKFQIRIEQLLKINKKY